MAPQNTIGLTSSVTFRGRVKKIYFSDEETDFYIFLAEDLDSLRAKAKKVKGYFFNPRIHPGVEFEVEGGWETHPKYGPTFVAKSASAVYHTNEAKETYLSAQLPSCGPVCASKILSKLGYDDAFDILDNDPDRLKTLDFLNERKAMAIAQEWRESRSYGNVATQLLGMGIPSRLVKKIFSELGSETIEIVTDNPYTLSLADGVDFPLADKIALNMGFAPDSDFRIASILEYLLELASRQRGHLYLEKGDLVKSLNRLPRKKKIKPFGRSLGRNDIDKALAEREKKERVVIDGDRVYLKWNYHVEHSCAEMLSKFAGDHDLGVDTDEFIEEYERIYKIQFSDEQSEAIKALNENKVLLLTGLPGTGKTTLTKALVRLFKQAGKKFKLVSPTGIAAKRLSTVVGEDAGTIHRTLGYKGEGKWEYDENRKYVIDAVIVDEFSMVDQNLLYRFLSALKKDTILVFVGDNAQLPSVGAGNVLHEMIKSDVIRRVHLTQIFRQEGASDIVVNAHRINSGEDLIISDPTDKSTDFRFIARDNPGEIVDGILHVVDKLYHGDSDATFQVLSPTYKGPLGVDLLNEQIKSLLNPLRHQQEVSLGGNHFREDDRVMVVENNYKLDVFNGEIGKLYRIDRKGKKLRTKVFDEPKDRLLDVPYSQAKRIMVLAYAMTCHKAQGQEWDYVIFPFHEMFSIQLQRNLLYTAVTRAKKKVFVFGQWKALRRAIHNDEVVQRNTAFAERLRKLIGN